MTRLTTVDIDAVCDDLKRYDRYLVETTGQSRLGIGAAASGMQDSFDLRRIAPSVKMAVVPIRSGLGIISGFTRTVCGILIHLGFDARVTAYTDVAGFAEAMEGKARVIMASDDDRFVAFCPGQSTVVDNAKATADGFVTGLDLMAGGLQTKRVLVLVCGPVGRWAVRALAARRAVVSVVDAVPGKAEELARWAQTNLQAAVHVSPDAEQALHDHDLIVDATNAAEVIHARHVTGRTMVAAPGMPRGLTDRAMDSMRGRVLHDPLQIGVATMACEAVRVLQASKTATNTDSEWRGA